MRSKMIELIREVQYLGGLEEKLADHLLANIRELDAEQEAGLTIRNLQLESEIKQLRDKIAESKPRWIPVSEMPNEACEIIVTDGIRTDVVNFSPIGTKSKPFGESLRLVCNFVDGTTMYPTHWMPRPELPKEEV